MTNPSRLSAVGEGVISMAPPPILPDPSQIQTFFHTLWPGQTAGVVGLLSGKKYAKHWTTTSPKDLQYLTQCASKIAPKNDVYFLVAAHDATARSTSRGKSDTAALLPGVWVDFDVAEKGNRKYNYPPQKVVDEYLASFPLKPSMLIDSGSMGRQVWWLFTEPMEAKAGHQLTVAVQEQIREDMAALGYDFDQTADLSRCMRVPGTIRYPDTTKDNITTTMPVRFVYCEADRRYDFEDFISEFRVPIGRGFYLDTRFAFKPDTEFRTDTRFIDTDSQVLWWDGVFPLCQNGRLEMFMDHGHNGGVIADKLLCLPIGKEFHCIIPGHEEQTPSAKLFRGAKGAVLYQDYHSRGRKQTYQLSEIYAFQFYGREVKLSPPLRATWGLRTLVDAQILPPAKVPHKPLPSYIKGDVRLIYEGFIRLLQCRWLYSKGDPAPFTYEFIPVWIDKKLRKPDIAKHLKWLRENGYMDVVGKLEADKTRSPLLYLPGCV